MSALLRWKRQNGPKCRIEHEGGVNQVTNEPAISPRTLRGASIRPNVVPGLYLALARSPSIRMVSSTSVGAAAIRRVPKR